MTGREKTASIAFSIGLVAALLGLCLRLMVPVGWMPVASANGVVFTLCSGDGGQQVLIDKHGTPVMPDGGPGQGHCAFSGTGTPALPDVPPAVALQIFLFFIAMGFAATPRLWIAASKRLRPPLRGPPLRV